MRISDWSSDVCSSDLAALSILEQEPGVESWCFRDLDTAACEIQLHTSGTTGKPEAVIKPLRCLEAEVEVLEAVFGACGAQSVLARSEERRGGKECVSTCSSRWSPYH